MTEPSGHATLEIRLRRMLEEVLRPAPDAAADPAGAGRPLHPTGIAAAARALAHRFFAGDPRSVAEILAAEIGLADDTGVPCPGSVAGLAEAEERAVRIFRDNALRGYSDEALRDALLPTFINLIPTGGRIHGGEAALEEVIRADPLPSPAEIGRMLEERLRLGPEGEERIPPVSGLYAGAILHALILAARSGKGFVLQ